MKKNKLKYLALASVATLLVPFGVSAGPAEDIATAGSSSADATINSIQYSTDELDPTFYIWWGDMKYNYSYNEATKLALWSRVNERENYCDQDSNMIKTANNMKKNTRVTVSFASNVSNVTASYSGSIQRMMTDEEWNATGNILDEDGDGIPENKCKFKDTVDLSEINSDSYVMENGQLAEVSFILDGGSYEDVSAAFNTETKKVGTFTVTIEDAQ